MAFGFDETEFPGNNNYCNDSGDWFEFGPGGILAVHYASGRDSRYLSPGAWRELRTDQPPGAPTLDRRDWGFPNYS